MGIADLKRVTDLFVEGEEVVLRDGPEPVLLWVNKLNSFATEEARRDGMAARSRYILSLKEIGTPEWTNLQAMVAEMGEAGLKKELVALQDNDFFLKAAESIRLDADWAERLAVVERESSDMTPEERALVEKINVDYVAEMETRIAALKETATRDLASMDVDSLRESYHEKWLERRAMESFSREYQKTQVYFSVRTCQATTKVADTSAWDHSRCEGHQQRALDDREEVPQLPDGLFQRLLAAVQRVTMGRSDARFSDVLASSSASSAQPSEVAESTPSTPAETSPELATTSS